MQHYRPFFSLFALFCLLFPCFLSSQNTSPAPTETQQSAFLHHLHFEVSFKGTFFLDRFFTEENSLDGAQLVNPYLLNGKLLYKNIGLRGSFGGRYKKEKIAEVGFADNISTTLRRTDWRLGLEYRFLAHPRWSVLAGFDYVNIWEEDKMVDDSGYDTITELTLEKGGGLGPSVGVLFHINKRIKLYAESYLYFTKTEATTGRYFRNFPVFDDTFFRTETQQLVVGMPSTVFLTIAF